MNKFLRNVPFINFLHIQMLKYFCKHLSRKQTRLHKKISNKNLYHVRISRGCVSNCSFCGIKKAIGTQRSTPIDECIQKCQSGLDQGNNHILLVGEDVGSYGLDINSNLPTLLKQLTAIPGQYTITLSGISPQWIITYIDQLEEIFKTQKIVNINIPLQSGSSRILTLMNKFSDTGKIKDAIIRLQKSYPKLALEAQLMVGFPTETEREFESTLSLVKELNFNIIFIIKFSNSPGTEAYTIQPKVSLKEVHQRFMYSKKYLRDAGYLNLFSKRSYLVFRRNDEEDGCV